MAKRADAYSVEPSEISLSRAAEIIMAAPLEIPIILWGNTGVGKTQLIESIGRMLVQPVKTTIAQITSPLDWTGIPFLKQIEGESGRFTEFSQPLHLPNTTIDGEKGIYFFDELPNATKSVQAAIQTLLTRGSYNGYDWPRQWKQVVAGNRRQDRANTFEMPRPVANRLMHLFVGYDPEAWNAWAAGSASAELRVPERVFPSIAEIDDEDSDEARVDPLVRAFIHVNPQVFAPEDNTKSDTFPTPRGWHMVSHVVRLGLDENLMMPMIQGLVGPAAAAQFMIYLNDTAILPDPRDLLTGKAKLMKKEGGTYLVKGAGTPKRLEASQLYAVSCAISSAIKPKSSKELDYFFECLDNMATPEYGIVAVNEVRNRLPEMAMTPQFAKWAEKSSEVMFG